MMISASSRNFYLRASKITITCQVMPLQVIHIDFMVARLIVGQAENLSVLNGFDPVEIWSACFKERGLVTVFIGFALHCITGTDQFFQPKALKVLSKIFGEVAPLRVIAGQQQRFAPKHIRVEFQVR